MAWSPAAGDQAVGDSPGDSGVRVEVLTAQVVRVQVRAELVQQRDAGGDVQPDDLVVWYRLQMLDQGPQGVAVRDYEHAAAGPQVRHDRVVPVWQQPRGNVAQGFGARLRLRRKHGVAGIVQLE